MRKLRILWTDDEIDLLKPHILFLQEKGYEVVTANNGDSAIKLSSRERFDIIFLDEHMPGLSGLETLEAIKAVDPALPVVIITKSEEEDIMNEAIGAKIADYLIKPVNPNQILLSIKKITENKRLVSRKVTSAYQSAFRDLGMQIQAAASYRDWCELYRKLTYWEMELESSEDKGMKEILKLQQAEANQGFVKYIRNHYRNWFGEPEGERPLMSPGIFRQAVLPALGQGKKVVFLLIDNLRYDQWKTIQPLISDHYTTESEELYVSILPTATQYARNAIFAGLMPLEISEMYPGLWIDEEEETGKNLHEEELLKKQLARLGKKISFRYDKINSLTAGKKMLDNVKDLLNFNLNVIVYNFVDVLSHARTEMEVIRELAGDEAAFRSLTRSWFIHSPLSEIIRRVSSMGLCLMITSDHGSVRVQNPLKVIGDRQTSTNLRYKQGKNLNYNPREVFDIADPREVHLPKSRMTSKYIFAGNYDFLAYPNNFNYYAGYYRNTFQHGGISLEEMLVPLITLNPIIT